MGAGVEPLVTFPSKEDFVGYSSDQERLKYLPLKEGSIERVY